jgi:hypothetical protein
MNKKILIFSFIVLVIRVPFLHSATLKYSEDFENHILNQPSTGRISVVRSIGPLVTCTEGVDYVLDAKGRNGSNGSFLSLQREGLLDAECWMWWVYGDTWPTNEIYVSMWVAYPHFVNTDSHENIKLFYPHWDGTDSYVAWDLSNPNAYYHSERSHGEYITNSNWISTPNAADGNFHHYEFFIDVANTIHRFWYDGVLVWDNKGTDVLWTTPLNLYYLTFGMIDAEEHGDFTRQFDDIEVWDGMPTNNAIPPPVPTVTVPQGFQNIVQ